LNPLSSTTVAEKGKKRRSYLKKPIRPNPRRQTWFNSILITALLPSPPQKRELGKTQVL